MKGCNYKKRGDVVPARWKAELLRWLRYELGLGILVETGTCIGSTCCYLHADFDEIYTVELSKGLYDNAKSNLESCGARNVKQYFGSSRTMLSVMLTDAPPGPVLVYLDAHGAGDGTCDDGDPLTDELRAVMQLRSEALIVIDDCADADLEPAQRGGIDFTGWHREYRAGEVLMWRLGQYDVPQFEDGVWQEEEDGKTTPSYGAALPRWSSKRIIADYLRQCELFHQKP
jgi:hypothetical protein